MLVSKWSTSCPQMYPVLSFLHPHSSLPSAYASSSSSQLFQDLACHDLPWLTHVGGHGKSWLLNQPIPEIYCDFSVFWTSTTWYLTLVTYSTLPSSKVFICCLRWGIGGKGSFQLQDKFWGCEVRYGDYDTTGKLRIQHHIFWSRWEWILKVLTTHTKFTTMRGDRCVN